MFDLSFIICCFEQLCGLLFKEDYARYLGLCRVLELARVVGAQKARTLFLS